MHLLRRATPTRIEPTPPPPPLRIGSHAEGQAGADAQARAAFEAAASAGQGPAQKGLRIRHIRFGCGKRLEAEGVNVAKQYLATPFSSAGVERSFSAAGKMHDVLHKSEKDSTLEHSLFAAFNTE